MSVQRIDRAESHTHGWQARAYVAGTRYVSRFFADKTHGGKRKAKAAAQAAESSLKRKAARSRGRA